MSLKSIQDRAASDLASKNENFGFDPAIIMVIFDVIMELIQSLQDCRKPQDAVAIAKSPTLLQKRLVALKVRRTMGRRAYRVDGQDVVDSILAAGQGVTVEEMEAAYNEVG